MKKYRLKLLLIAAAMLIIVYPPMQVQAKVLEFSDLYMQVTVPEDTILLTTETSNLDEQWGKAGITDPKAEKDNMNKMDVQAILYDPATDTTVNLLQKQSDASRDAFNLSLLTEDEFKKFLDGLITADDANTVIKVEKYPQQEIPFFRISIEMTKDNTPMKEIIYGTVVNGNTVTFDIYANNSAEPLDESYIKELVAGTHFTKYLDKAEVIRQGRTARIYFIASVSIFIAFIVLWLFLRRKKQKKLEILKKRKLEALEQFYKDKKIKEEQHSKDTVLYVNKTRYTEDIIKKFFFYNEIFKRKLQWGMTAVMYVLLFISLYQPAYAFLYYLGAGVILVAFIYFQGTQIEKLIKNTVKSYGQSIDHEVSATFYEDYFTVTGIQYNSTVPYVQITEVREYQEFIYLYLGYNKAYYLKKGGFEQGAQDFRKFIEQRIYLK